MCLRAPLRLVRNERQAIKKIKIREFRFFNILTFLKLIIKIRDVVWLSGMSYPVYKKILEFKSQGKPNYFNDWSYRFGQNLTRIGIITDYMSSSGFRRLYKEDYWWILSTSHDPTNPIALVAGRIYRDRTKIRRTSHKKWHDLHVNLNICMCLRAPLRLFRYERQTIKKKNYNIKTFGKAIIYLFDGL